MRLSGRKPSSFTRRWTQKPQVVLLGLIGVNVAAFVAQIFLESSQPGFVGEYLGLSAAGLDAAYAWQLLTAIFLHASPWYFVGHLLVLFFLGRDVESIVGQRHFLYLYLGGAIAGELGHLFFMPTSSIVMAASGGVAAIVVAYATILPEMELTSIILGVPRFRLKAKHLTVVAFVIGLAGLIWHRSSPVVHSAYLGGCVGGWLYAHLLGFGRPSIIQRTLQQRRVEAERFETMSAEQFISEAVDPILDKVFREGLASLTASERRTLARAHEKVAAKLATR